MPQENRFLNKKEGWPSGHPFFLVTMLSAYRLPVELVAAVVLVEIVAVPQERAQACTGVAVAEKGTVRSFVQKTEVEFFELSDETIESYVETSEPMDKAGAYGIQGKGSVLVKGIVGDYFNVMGFPVAETARFLGLVK